MSMISTIHGEERSISGDGPDAFEDGPVMPPKTSQDKRGTKVRDLIKKQLHLEKSARNQHNRAGKAQSLSEAEDRNALYMAYDDIMRPAAQPLSALRQK
ncbi:hypothetical protein DL546_005375 [Coniochaeta pulveracea]|uniref:Uncharacterized protein n=1 Tax=Coniochaeta pulveracea TaxID=177199 RepID=A0A420Y372_9PEZI|nr:hypothetical protein DL546_005375 [Coniochaeta pulveracea]